MASIPSLVYALFIWLAFVQIEVLKILAMRNSLLYGFFEFIENII